jgi:sterol desaturase/sphingolipid hydroxylase (fatty acid hydroxylase superfamily)
MPETGLSAAYWTLFAVLFLAFAVWESFRPKRPLSFSTERRWGRHALLLAVSGAAQTAIFRVPPVVLAAAVASSRFGILNRPWLPFTLRCVIAVLALDLTHYGTHRILHSVPCLWRVHEVHHSDPDYDVSTAARFHPLEVVAVQGVYLGVVALLAPPPAAVFAAELLTVALNLFAHANVSVPPGTEKLLRRVIITPGLHRIHHSEVVAEQSHNLGQTFPWWDRLFGTYLAQPAAGEEGIVTGITGLRNDQSLGFGFMLAEPFRRRSEPPLGRP